MREGAYSSQWEVVISTHGWWWLWFSSGARNYASHYFDLLPILYIELLHLKDIWMAQGTRLKLVIIICYTFLFCRNFPADTITMQRGVRKLATRDEDSQAPIYL